MVFEVFNQGNGASKGGKKLTGGQAEEIRRLIRNKYPDQLKLSFGLCTREAVREAIRNRYDIDSVAGRLLFKELGLYPSKDDNLYQSELKFIPEVVIVRSNIIFGMKIKSSCQKPNN